MKPSNELFDLIKSLTKSEKRFFKLQSSLQGGDKNYVRIFDLIDDMDEYDEEVVKETFKNERFIKHLPSEKNHLYKLILKSLRGYYGENSISSLLQQEIKNIEILYNKGLFHECSKFLQRAKKIAAKHDRFYYWFELLHWEKTLLEDEFEDGRFVDLDALIQEEQEVIAKLRNLAEYHVLYSKINYVFRSGGYTRTEENKKLVDEIMNHPLIQGKNTALSSSAATICRYTQGFCSLANGDYDTALERFHRVIQILDEEPLLRSDLSKRYIRTLNNIVKCYLYLGKYDEAEKHIQIIRSMSEEEGFTTPDMRALIFKNAELMELQVLQRTGRFEEAVKKAEDLTVPLRQYESMIHKEYLLFFYFGISYCYFGVGQYNKALHWLNRALNDHDGSLRQDFYSYLRLYNLAVHYELGNNSLLQYAIQSTTRYLQKRMRDFPVEKVIIQHFKKLIRADSLAEKKRAYKRFQEHLLSVIQTPEDKVILRYFDFVSWLESKVEGISMSEAVKRDVLHKLEA